MRILIKTTAVSALILILGACSEQPFLEDLSTEEIVAEYHSRLESIGSEYPLPSSKSFYADVINDRLSAEEKLSLGDQLEKWINDISPFIDAGEEGPMTLVGSILLDGSFSLITPNVCEGLSLLYAAALTDNGHAAVGIAQYFKLTSTFITDSRAKRTALYWAKEAAQRNTDLRFILNIETENFTNLQRTEFNSEWIDWSPATDQGIQEEIELACGE